MPLILHKQSGFTLIEVIATLAIILFGVLAAFSALTLATRAGNESVNRTVATHLAEEGLEIVRNIRDNNEINGLAFDAGLADGTYLVFYGSPGLTPSVIAAGATPPPLDVNPTTGLYGHDQARWPSSGFTGAPSKYTRTILIQHATDAGAGSTSYLRVTCVVSWPANGVEQVVLEAHLYDWRP